MAVRYKTIKVEGRTVLLHRHVVEQQLGRKLLRSEQVHHRNGDRYDNRPENLEVLDAAAHQALHKQKHPRVKSCAICGSEFTPPPTKRKRMEACSPACGYRLGWTKRRARPPVAAALVRANIAAIRGSSKRSAA